MTKRINLLSPVVGLTFGANPLTVASELANELVQRGVATFVDAPDGSVSDAVFSAAQSAAIAAAGGGGVLAVTGTPPVVQSGQVAAMQMMVGDYVEAGTVTTDSLVAWSPSMSGARLWYCAEDAKNQAGNPAVALDPVYSIPNRIASTSRADSQPMPLVIKAAALAAGTAANAPVKRNALPLGGVYPVGFGLAVGGTTAHRLSTQTGAITLTAPHRVFMVASMRGVSFPYLVSVSGAAGNSLVSGNGARQLRCGTDNQVFGTFADSTPFLLSLERVGTEQLFETAVAVTSTYGRLNGLNAFGNGTAAANVPGADLAFLLGNRSDVDVATDMDFYEAIVIEGHATQAEIWRIEGYLSWKYGLQASLPGDHPYRSRAPVVPAGATTAAQYDVCAYPWGFRQVMSGYHFELADDNIAAGDGAQGTDQSRSVLYDLKPAERKRLAGLFYGAHSVRVGLGIYYRGSRSVDGTSLLSNSIGPRLPQQRQHLWEFARDANIKGIAPEYWSPAPHWKTTSAFAGGTLWAGAAYSRATTLDSIRVSDAAQYAAQIGLFTTSVVGDLEDLHSHDTYPLRVVAFGLQNEPLGADAGYGSCTYTPQLYIDVLKSLIPKIRNSAKLSSWGGSPNTVAIHANSWGGPYDTIATAIVADATVLSTGKTAVQELAYWAHHRITEQNANVEVTLTSTGTGSDSGGQPYYNYRLAASNPNGIPVANNEYEFFSSLGRPTQFANLAQSWINHMNWMKAPIITLIHAAKPSTDAVAERYAIASWRVPGDVGVPVDYAAGIDFGEFAINDVNYNAAKPFIQYLTGAQYLFTQEATYDATKKVGAFFTARGKLAVVLVNSGASTAVISVDTGPSARTLRGIQYSATQRDVPVSSGSVKSTRISASVPAKSMQIYIEP